MRGLATHVHTDGPSTKLRWKRQTGHSWQGLARWGWVVEKASMTVGGRGLLHHGVTLGAGDRVSYKIAYSSEAPITNLGGLILALDLKA